MKKYRVGIIGCGNIANVKHMPTLAKMEEIEMVAFCDIIPERAWEAAKKYGTPDAKCYTDYHEMLKDETIDNIHVLTHNRPHAQISIDALDAGKNVLCEKPMAITSEEAAKMLEARNRSGKVLAVGYQHKFDADVMYVKDEADKGVFGDIYHAKCRVLRRRGAPVYGYFIDEKEKHKDIINIV